MAGSERPERKFTVADRLTLETGIVLNVGHIADVLEMLDGADGLDRGEAMVAADAVRRRMLEVAIATLEEELGARFDPPGTRRKVYYRVRSFPNGGPNPCPQCGISGSVPRDERTENVRREDLPEWVTRRLDRGMYATEDCPRCGRMVGTYGVIEVEDY